MNKNKKSLKKQILHKSGILGSNVTNNITFIMGQIEKKINDQTFHQFKNLIPG